MVIRLSAEYGDGGREASRIIKLFPQEYEILIMGVLICRDKLAAGVSKSDDNYGIMKTFEKLLDQLIEEDSMWRHGSVTVAENDDDGDDVAPSRTRQQAEDQKEEMGMVKVEYDEFLGVTGLEGPCMGRDLAGWKLIDEERAKYKESHDHYSLNAMVYDWLRRPEMRKKVKIVDSLDA